MTGEVSQQLEREQGVALWRQVEIALTAELSALPADGDRRLPSEHELARRFGVNRHTIRQAVRALAERGLVRVVRGRGTYARDPILDYRLGRDTRFSANLLAKERLPERQLLGSRVEDATVELAGRLGLTVPAKLVTIDTLGLADGVPVCLGTLHLGADRFGDAASRFDGSVSGLYAGYGITDHHRQFTRLHARAAEPSERRLLRQGAADPVIVTEAVDLAAGGEPIAISIGRWAASRIQFTIVS